MYIKTANRELPEYHFKNSRWQWYYQNTTDAGWPIKDGLLISLKKDATMVGPASFWKAADAPVLTLYGNISSWCKKSEDLMEVI